jgi:hypothetical protein
MGEILQLALPPHAFCISGAGHVGLQKPCADSQHSLPRVIRRAPQVVAGAALVTFWTAALLR